MKNAIKKLVRELKGAKMGEAEAQQIVEMLKTRLDWPDDKIAAWLEIKNDLLGGVAPQDMLAIGRGDKLIKIVNYLLQEGGN